MAAAFAWWICWDRNFFYWDEFSHWGRAIKCLFYENVLPSVAKIESAFKTYPPIISVLQSTLSKVVWLEYREDAMIFVQAFLSASILIYPLKSIKSVLGKCLMFASLLALPLIFWPNYYTMIYMDGILGLLFGFALVVYALEENSRFKMALLALGAFTLCLTKTTGIVFLAFVAGIILIDILSKKQYSIKAFLPLVAAVSGAGVGQISWLVHININNVAQLWSLSSFSMGALSDLIFKGQPSYRVETINNFFKDIVGNFKYGSFLNFSYIIWFVLFASGIILLWRFAKNIDKVLLKSAAYLCVCGILYALLTLGNYLFVFDGALAVILVSIERYLNTFLVAILMFGLSIVAPLFNKINIKTGAIFAVSYFAIWLLVVTPSPKWVLGDLIFARKAAFASSSEAKIYSSAAQQMMKATDNHPEKVRVIAQCDTGFIFYRLSYEMAPYVYNTGGTGIRTQEIDTDDYWNEYYTLQTLEKQLHDNFEYVYIFELDQDFKDSFTPLFENPDILEHTIYKINKNNGKITLSR